MWFMDVLIVVVIAAGIYGFVVLTRQRTRRLSSHTNRTAQDMYDEFADSPAAQRRYARKRGGTWRENG